MTLVELCEPAFQYVCKINRLGRAGGTASPRMVRDELRALIADIKAKAEKENLGPQFEKIELPVIFFVDEMIRESKLAASWGMGGGWRDLAEDRRELAGGQKFFDILEETLLESGESANQRLAVFYTMIGLGFTGFYATDPSHLRRKTREIAARVRGLVDADQTGRICPDTYENVDTRMLTQPPARKLMAWVVVLITMVAVLVASYIYTSYSATRDIGEQLQKVIDAAPKTPVVSK